MHKESLFKTDVINTTGLDLDLTRTRLPGLGPFHEPRLCSRTFIVAILDPFKEIDDVDRRNNVLVFPIRRNCSRNSQGNLLDECSVIPDWKVMGEIKSKFFVITEKLFITATSPLTKWTFIWSDQTSCRIFLTIKRIPVNRVFSTL